MDIFSIPNQLTYYFVRSNANDFEDKILFVVCMLVKEKACFTNITHFPTFLSFKLSQKLLLICCKQGKHSVIQVNFS